MDISNNAVKVISIGNSDIEKSNLEGGIPYEHFENFRAVKKQFRHGKPALIIGCIGNENDEKLCIQVTEFIRIGLVNQDTRIILLYNTEYSLDELHWMSALQVNGCLQAIESKMSFNIAICKREIDTFIHIDNSRLQHEAETDMLMCISRFSKEKESISNLLKTFSSTLSVLCYATCSFHIKIESNSQGTIDYCNFEHESVINELNHIFNLPSLPTLLQNTLDEKQPQINLLPEELDLNFIEKYSGEKIGSYLTFPIIVYTKSLYLLIYLIPENHMDKVTMKQINIINKASEQLTMLLERRQAENSLKKQYQRLKTTLVDLKTTKKELEHKEKMASIGQLAAGIAHEINNPLSYVMSNFLCMDDYLKSIMQLQQLQTEFLMSLDIEETAKITELKSNISKFEEEEDIAFVLQDIKAVITDSHNGLMRVKNIITDLKSFTYSQSTELELCNLTQVINDTLIMLSYDLDKSITIKKELESLPDLMAHGGLMQQVLTNLIKNAGQALIESNTVDPLIFIKTQVKESAICLTIRDNGPGIPNEVQGKIFDPFYTTKTVGEGTGLGLSVTFNIIKKLGGTISVSSILNEFTEFTILFSNENNS